MTHDLVRRLQQLDVVYREPVVLKNAGVSDTYIDIKKACGHPDVLRSLCDLLWERMDKSVTCIAAAGYGGLSLASVLSVQQGVYLTLVRDEQKKHGKGGWIDGYVPNEHDRITIVDDVFTTCGSLRKMIRVLKPTKARILGCCVVVKRGDGELNVPLTYLLTSEELL